MNAVYELSLIYAREKFKKYMQEDHNDAGCDQDVQKLLSRTLEGR